MTSYLDEELVRLEELRERLNCQGAISRRWFGRLRREWEAGVVAGSTGIEGVPVTVDDVRRILAGDRPMWICEKDCEAVEGYGGAMDYAMRRADEQASWIDARFVLGIHMRVMGGNLAEEAGSFRGKNVWLGDSGSGAVVYQPPDFREAPLLVDELCEWMRDTDEPAAIASALVHARFAGIHPFKDGNGRVARILSSFMMQRGGYGTQEFTSLEEWWGTHKDDYYRSFADLGYKWTPDADVTRFVTIHVRACRMQVERFWLKQAVECEIWNLIEGFVIEDLGGEPRLAEALFDAFFGRPVTNRYYRSLVGITGKQAAADLAMLEERKLLEGGGRDRETLHTGGFPLVAGVAAAAGTALSTEAGGDLDAQRAHVVTAIAERVEAAGMSAERAG